MSNCNNNFIKNLGGFRNFCVNNFPFLDSDFDSLTTYELLSKVICYLKQIGALTEELNTAFNELKSWVEDYIDNLDFTELVNEKIEEMYDNGLFQDFFIENNTIQNINIVYPVWINDKKPFIPETNVSNGFAMDSIYFYIAHHTRENGDNDFLTITKINRETFESVDYTTHITGHGNSLSIYNNHLYVVDSSSTNGTVHVLDKDTPSNNVIGSFTFDPKIVAFDIKNLESATPNTLNCCAIEWNNKTFVSKYIDSASGIARFNNRCLFKETPNQYSQGLAMSYNCIYTAWSYGTSYPTLQAIPQICAHAWDGFLLNKMYISLFDVNSTNISDYELEDIYRPLDGENVIYFVTGSGKIGKVDTEYFTTSESHHQYSSYSFRNTDIFKAIHAKNTDSQTIFYDDCKVAKEIPFNPFSTTSSGFYIGTGLICGNNALFFLRGSVISGFMIDDNPNTFTISAGVTYTISSNKALFSRGEITRLNTTTGEFLRENLLDYSKTQPSLVTTINSLHHIPLDIPFSSNTDVVIPLPN